MAKCAFMDCEFGGLYTAPKLDGKVYCLHHREVMLRGLKESLIQRQAEALDVAEYAFKFIVNRGCLCAFTQEGEEHDPMCKVLAAQNALDAIKEKMGDR
ncbi:hypothetical protein LCGC14_1348610 [marine sediment metagenome]|uniref:Uncharacterized protein n=1 Tax=marine sediment metagenome TaxID=412755 RepID=A0A0F9KBL9_9ZZZZ